MEQIGRYRIEKEIGRGAMGVVYRAQDPVIGRTVALKTIKLSEFGTEEEAAELRDRLAREARYAGSLSHPGIITVHDVGREGDLDFIVMQFVNGPTLEKVLAQPERQTTDTFLRIIREAGAALDHAHSKGVIHRDIKPANIMLDEDGTVKIADFGIAKLTATTRMTRTGLVVGTPYYMSPEQVQDKPIAGRADQFSLAVVAYEMLTGERPFNAATLTAVIYKIMWEEPAEPQRLNPRLGPQVNEVLRRALAKNPDQRYPTCAAFAADLTEACRIAKTQVHPAVVTPPPGPAPATTAVPATVTPVSPPPPAAPVAKARQKKDFWVAGGVAAAILAGLGGWRLLESPPEPVPVQEAAQISQAPTTPVQPAQENPAPPPQEPTAAPESQPAPEPVKPERHAQSEPKPVVRQPAPVVKTEEVHAAPQIPPPQPQRATQEQPPPKIEPDPPRAEAPAPKPFVPQDGSITWGGQLNKGAILIIDGNHASTGSVSGSLPGVPVKIDVEAEGIEIQDVPGPHNNWRRFVFRNGKDRVKRIVIRWRTRPA